MADGSVSLSGGGVPGTLTRTDAAGRFRFEGLSPSPQANPYRLEVRGEGYDPLEKIVHLTSDVSMNLQLMPNRPQTGTLSGFLSRENAICPDPDPQLRLPCIRQRFVTHRKGTLSIVINPVAADNWAPVQAVVLRELADGSTERLLHVRDRFQKASLEVDGPAAFWVHALLGERPGDRATETWIGVDYIIPP